MDNVTFIPKAKKIWESIPSDIRVKYEIMPGMYKIEKRELVLRGICTRWSGKVA
jgi:hypothetical protein